MKNKTLLILCLSILFVIDVDGQLFEIGMNIKDTIRIETSKFGGQRYFQNENEFGLADMTYLFYNTDLPAFKNMKDANSYDNYAALSRYLGTLILGLQVVNIVRNKKIDFSAVGFGAGMFILINIPLKEKSKKKAKVAIEQFNSTR